jgi:hypothetical protein
VLATAVGWQRFKAQPAATRGIAAAVSTAKLHSGVNYVIDVLPAADIDRLEALWRELLSHRGYRHHC